MQALHFRFKALRAARAFTLVEAMITVVIVGVLATLAIAGTRKYIATSKTSEAIDMIGYIRAAQEAYKQEMFGYLNVSQDFSDASYYPANPTPGRAKMLFAGTGTGQAGWQTLNVQTDGPVTFVYATTAGANGTPTALGTDITVGNWPATVNAPWYVIKARADFTGSGVNTVFAAGSFSNDLYSANAP
jgi:prepilin-type N-terminal cleavage/methylation domain-containing protein